MMVDFLLILFIVLCAIFALGVVTRKNQVSSVLCLIVVFIFASALLLLLGAEFMAMTLIILYLGAIVVLFLFVVMMLSPSPYTERFSIHHSVICTLVVFPLAVMLGVGAFIAIAPMSSAKISVFMVSDIGMSLFSDFNLEVMAVGIILLAAVVSAVVLTSQKRDRKCQNLAGQLNRKAALELKDIPSGKGVDW